MSRAYEADFYSWAMHQGDALRRRSANELDWDNLAEELESLGRSQQNELYSRYVVLLAHLLKWIVQPDLRSRSWRATIAEQRRAIERLLRQNPGLKSLEASTFAEAYLDARDRASGETDLDVESFPEEPPFTLIDATDGDWWPA